MQLKLSRRARRRIAESGGALTLDACSDSTCWCGARLQARAGEPENPGDYHQSEADGVRVFTRGQIRRADGQVRSADTVVPRHVRIRERRGRLVAHVG